MVLVTIVVVYVGSLRYIPWYGHKLSFSCDHTSKSQTISSSLASRDPVSDNSVTGPPPRGVLYPANVTNANCTPKNYCSS